MSASQFLNSVRIHYCEPAKGDRERKAVVVSYSPMAVLADASEITGLPRDNFEVQVISKKEFDAWTH